MRRRTIGALIVLNLVVSVQADAKPWSVDVPGDWSEYSLPVVKQRLENLRKVRGIRRADLHTYSAGAGGVLIIHPLVIDPETSTQTVSTLEEVDQALRAAEHAIPGTTELRYVISVVDDQLVVHSEHSIPGGGFRDLRILALDGDGLVHVLHVGCFSPNGAFDLCARVQQSARLTPPGAGQARGHTREIVLGIAGFGVLVMIFFALRKREQPVEPMRVVGPRPEPPPAARPQSPSTTPAPAPEYDHRYLPNRPRRSSRMPSSIPLEDPDEIGGAVRSQVETAQRGTKISYAAAVITLSQAGIAATREDGVTVNVGWNDLVGIVARRLPPRAPYDSATFIDLISAPGETLRLVPWTQIAGIEIFGSVEERARSFAKLVAKRCPTARLDGASRTFVDGTDSAPQLPDVETLGEHDRRLA